MVQYSGALATQQCCQVSIDIVCIHAVLLGRMALQKPSMEVIQVADQHISLACELMMVDNLH